MGLRIQVYGQSPFAGGGKNGRKIDHRGRLADSPFWLSTAITVGLEDWVIDDLFPDISGRQIAFASKDSVQHAVDKARLNAAVFLASSMAY